VHLGLAEASVAESLRKGVLGNGGHDARMDSGVEIGLAARGPAVDGGRRVVGEVTVVDNQRLLED